MSYDWNQYYKLADLLYNEDINIDGETLARNIISRAYYSTHNLARILKYSIDGVPLKEQKHEKVVNFFSLYDHKNGTNIHDGLDSLRKMRGKVDYEEDSRFSLKEAEYALLEAHEVIQQLSKQSG